MVVVVVVVVLVVVVVVVGIIMVISYKNRFAILQGRANGINLVKAR